MKFMKLLLNLILGIIDTSLKIIYELVSNKDNLVHKFIACYILTY